MKNFTKILVFGLIAFFASSLSSCKLLRLQPERTIETKTVYVETIKDTTIFVPADTSSFYALFECDSMNQVYLKALSQLQGERSKIDLKVKSKGNQLIVTADCVCDSLNIYMQYKERYYSETKKEKEVVKVEGKKCNRINIFFWGFGCAVILILVIALLYNIFKYKIETWINMILK